MHINIERYVIQQVVNDLLDNPYDAIEYIQNSKKASGMVAWIDRGYQNYFGNNGGKLTVKRLNTDLQEAMEFEESYKAISETPLDEMINEYIEDADGSWPTSDMRSHADQLREFAERIDKVCDGLDADELEAMNEPNT